MNTTPAQLRLAASIIETGHPWEYYAPYSAGKPDPHWEEPSTLDTPARHVGQGREIRLAFARPPYEAELHNPDNLTPEQVGAGYRLCLLGEKLPEGYDYWHTDARQWLEGTNDGIIVTEGRKSRRLPLSVPWPEQPKPFTLPTPPPGMKWHREDGWTAEMLPPGTRPLCFGERVEDKGCESYIEHAWVEQRITGSMSISNAHRNSFLRTTRPLLFQHAGHEWTWHRAGDPMPCAMDARVYVLCKEGVHRANAIPAKDYRWTQDNTADIIGWRYADVEQPDPYAALKKAHAEGKVIQGCIRGHWIDCPHPTWKYPLDTYRIKPDDGPPWTEWPGGECPLKDEEVEEWEYKMRDGRTRKCDSPNTRRWEHIACESDIVAYRVLKWREKKPKVQLGPEDVPPFSLLRAKGFNDKWNWLPIEAIDPAFGVRVISKELSTSHEWIGWGNLENHEINRPRHRDENGNPTLWEACEK
jgi:hypothetical protein